MTTTEKTTYHAIAELVFATDGSVFWNVSVRQTQQPDEAKHPVARCHTPQELRACLKGLRAGGAGVATLEMKTAWPPTA